MTVTKQRLESTLGPRTALPGSVGKHPPLWRVADQLEGKRYGSEFITRTAR